MIKQILFIHGGGKDGYQADSSIVNALSAALGEQYHINYGSIKSDESKPDFGWLDQIAIKIEEGAENLIIVAHSLGASMLLKYLTEHPVIKEIKAIFLLAAPFWSGEEDWQKGLMLKTGFEKNLPAYTPLYFYHAKDDKEIPFEHMGNYKKLIKGAILRELKSGGHQFNNITLLAGDIKSL